MWPIPALEHELCTVSFSSDSIVCSWIQKMDNGLAPLVLRAYKRYSLDSGELAHMMLFNPTVIKQYISSFLYEHNKADAFIVFSLESPAVTEQFVALPTSTPHPTDFGGTQSSNSLWGYRYLYPNDHGQFVFYLYSVPRSLILQYQLLAIVMQCNLITITTQSIALLTMYKHVFGTAFRRSQLAVDMMRHNNALDELVSVDILKRMINCSAVIALQDEQLHIATAGGLFFDERIDG